VSAQNETVLGSQVHVELMLQFTLAQQQLQFYRGKEMKHIHAKNDWFYEFRPYLIAVIGVFGLLNQSLVSTSANWIHLSQFCGLVLLVTAFKIHKWRKHYRKLRAHH
jgi:hypothetical protein